MTKWNWVFRIILIAIVMLSWLYEASWLDIKISDFFFYPESPNLYPKGRWLWPKDDQVLTFFLHDLINKIFVSIGILSILTLISSRYIKALQTYRNIMILMILSLSLVPSSIAIFNRYSHRYCPAKLEHYGGYVLDNYNPWQLSQDQLREADCFPAAHASSGFSLMIPGAVAIKRRKRILGYLTGIISGTMLSIIQIGRGEHFFSHCLATAIIAFLITDFIAIINKKYFSKNNL